MTRIALVVSDVDGTLLTKNKILTEKAARAVRRLEDSGVGFTIISSRPTIGMRFLVEPLRITLPVGSVQRQFDLRSATEPDRAASDPGIGGATQPRYAEPIRRRYLAVHQRQLADRATPTANTSVRKAHHQGRPCHRRGFRALSVGRLQDRRLQRRCGAAAALRSRDAGGAWARRRPRPARKAIISTSRRRATTRAPSCRRWPSGLAFRPMRSPPSATCTMIWRCFERAACRSRWAMRPTRSRSRRRMSRRRTRTRVLPARSR